MAASTSADGDVRVLNKFWKERSKYMLDTGLYADVKIKVKYSDNGIFNCFKTFQAHSLYLKWASPVFEKMLEGNFKESSYVIEFKHCPEAFQDLMTFIYLDHVDIQSSRVAWDLYDIAHKYDIKRLDALCTDYIEKHLTAQTVWMAFIRSRIYNLTNIEKLSYNFIVTKTSEVLCIDDFVHLEEGAISFLLDQPALNIPEAMLFNSVELWINAEVERKGQSEEQQEEAKKSIIKQFVPKIHFFDMTYQEILDGPNKSDILTMEQKWSILTNLLKTNAQEQLNLAEGLSVFPKMRNGGTRICVSPNSLNEVDKSPAYSVEFETDSYIVLDICINWDYDVISFQFKTTSSNCLIFSMYESYDLYLDFGVEYGNLHLRYYCYSSYDTILSDDRVDDGELHNILIIFRPYNIDMILDSDLKTLSKSPDKYVDAPLRIGCRDADHEFSIGTVNGFDGCISSLIISSLSKQIDFHTDSRETSNVKFC